VEGFIGSIGSLSCGGKPKVYNPPPTFKKGEEPPAMKQYTEATTKKERDAIYEKEKRKIELEKAADRKLIC